MSKVSAALLFGSLLLTLGCPKTPESKTQASKTTKTQPSSQATKTAKTTKTTPKESPAKNLPVVRYFAFKG